MKIYICGDSTAASYTEDLAPLTGWGQVLSRFFEGVEICNHAMAGRSSKSFLYEGRLMPVEEALCPGDLVLIQFGHNDASDFRWRHTEPWLGFTHALNLYIQTARLYQAQPVLLTPICIRNFEDGVLRPSHGVYPDAIRQLALQTGTPLIDMYQMTFDMVRELGEQESNALYMNLQSGIWPGYMEGRVDNTHTTALGAERYAKLVADALMNLGLLR